MAGINKRYKIENSRDGFTIWRNNFWILDASTFLTDGTIVIDTKHFDLSKNKDSGDLELKLKN